MIKILSADIGGTNSRFASFKVNEGGELALMESIWLRTGDALSFGHLLENLKASDFHLKPEEADIAVFAIAGPVDNGTRCSPPFITWDVDISNVPKDFGLKWPVLINDFVAQAYACRSVIGEDAEQVKPGRIIRDAAAAVIGAGTALGKAVILPDGKGGYLASPSEGGHASFAFESKRECDFQQFLIREIGDPYITWNKIVSGGGLSHIHRFLTGEKLDPEEVISRILPGSETLEWASRFYGRACRNFALEILSVGGVYIAGGVAARTPVLVTDGVFREEFVRSNTMSDLLSNIPVFLIKEQDAGLWGSAVLGLQKLRESGSL